MDVLTQRQEIASKFGLLDAAYEDLWRLVFDRIFPGEEYDEVKSRLESQYLTECIYHFNLLDNAGWSEVRDAYLLSVEFQLNSINEPQEKKAWLIGEISRFQIAQTLQLNKFIAQEEDIQNFIGEL